jgi:lysyl-tRNA synthetase class 2
MSPLPSSNRSVHGTVTHLRTRAAILAEVRAFFAARDFLEVDTPVMVRSPGLDVHLDAFELAGGVAGEPAFLSTSPEYHMKRLLVAGLPRIFQIAHCFRAGESGAWHNPEFLMLEWYRAHSGIEQVMADTEELVREVVTRHTGAAALRVGDHALTLERPFPRLGVVEAFRRHGACADLEPLSLARDDEDRFFRVWVERVEPALARLSTPLFLVDFPATMASLARRKPGEPELCERFELYLGGIELCNGFGELTDPVEQRARLLADQRRRAELGKPVYPIDERFLDALGNGMPPSGGNALGLDRLVALCAGASSIGEIQSFPLERL